MPRSSSASWATRRRRRRPWRPWATPRGSSGGNWPGGSGFASSPRFTSSWTSRSSAACAYSACCAGWPSSRKRGGAMFPAETVAETLKNRRNILLLNHEAPDGDCLGSTLALAKALWARGQRATVGSSDGVPEMYRFLPSIDRVVTAIPEGETFDTVVFMECSVPERAGRLAAHAAGVPLRVNIDHHVSNTGYGDLVLWDVDAAAVAEVVYPIVRILHPRPDADTATCLLTALMTDTGSFHYASVTPRSFQLAAELMGVGASPEGVFRQVYENRSAASVRLLGGALSRLTLSDDGRVAWTTLTPEMLREPGGAMEDSGGSIRP